MGNRLNRIKEIRENHCIHCTDGCKHLPECYDVWSKKYCNMYCSICDKLLGYLEYDTELNEDEMNHCLLCQDCLSKQENSPLVICQCCKSTWATRKDYRNNSGCVGSKAVCDDCFMLTDKDFWELYNLTDYPKTGMPFNFLPPENKAIKDKFFNVERS